jgi:thymidine kinase
MNNKPMTAKPEVTNRKNSIELLLGPMRSNKTEELLRRVAMRREYANQDVMIFKPSDDLKSKAGIIESRNKKGWGKMEAMEIASHEPELMWDMIAAREREIGRKVQCIAIDEGQFLARLFPMVGSLLEAGYDVIAAGLDLDFRGLPFGDMLELMWYVPVYGGNTTWCISYCKCGERAFFSQRLINGEPAPYDSQVTLAGEMYEPRCREHFILPGRPKNLPW